MLGYQLRHSQLTAILTTDNTTNNTMAKKATSKKTVSTKAATKKTAAPKEAAPAKKAAKKAPAKKAVAKKAAAPKAAAPKATTIVAKIDVGFGNELYLRGEGAGLSWSAGTLMDCTADDEWTFTAKGSSGDILVKFLINDAAWSEGENFEITAGETNVIEPKF